MFHPDPPRARAAMGKLMIIQETEKHAAARNTTTVANYNTLQHTALSTD